MQTKLQANDGLNQSRGIVSGILLPDRMDPDRMDISIQVCKFGLTSLHNNCMCCRKTTAPKRMSCLQLVAGSNAHAQFICLLHRPHPAAASL